MSVPDQPPGNNRFDIANINANLAWFIAHRYAQLYPGMILPWNWRELLRNGDQELTARIIDVLTHLEDEL